MQLHDTELAVENQDGSFIETSKKKKKGLEEKGNHWLFKLREKYMIVNT